MLKALIFVTTLLFIGTTVSIYSISVADVSNNVINFNNYRNKKILIVNTASGSNKVSQLAQLQQLYMQHRDSLVVLAFPSNTFGNEPKTNAEIKVFMQSGYGITFPIAVKSPVRGDSSNMLYSWLNSKNQNEVMNGKTKTDFQKYLVNKNGKIVAVFDSSVSPLSTLIQTAIHSN